VGRSNELPLLNSLLLGLRRSLGELQTPRSRVPPGGSALGLDLQMGEDALNGLADGLPTVTLQQAPDEAFP
jgi:hypothetical protein